MRNRGFEKVEKFKDINFNLPKRSTKHSAGYDFESPIDVDILPDEIKIVTTGVKAYMKEDEVLELYNRSSNGKKGLIIPNSVGIIDSDYYNNPENEGEISFLFKNTTKEVFKIKKGDRIGQGIFKKFLTIDNEEKIINTREGGFGSTNKKGITLIATAIAIIILLIILGVTVNLVVYNITQSRQNNYLSEANMVLDAVEKEIYFARIEGREIPIDLKNDPLTPEQYVEYDEYLNFSYDPNNLKYYFLKGTQLELLNLKNVADKEYIVNWDGGEVIRIVDENTIIKVEN